MWHFVKRPSGRIAVYYKSILLVVIDDLDVAEKMFQVAMRELAEARKGE